MRPGTTKAVNLGTGYERLATLYDATMNDAILSTDGNEKANQALITITAANADIAYGSSLPTIVGHKIPSDSSMTMGNSEFIKRAWLRNTTAGSVAVCSITPIFE